MATLSRSGGGVNRKGTVTPMRGIRVPERQWRLYEKAAAAAEISVSELIRTGAEKEARRLLRENRGEE